MVKEYWITNSRFKIILIALMVIWIGFMVFFYLKADEITKDPCQICSERMGEKVICTTKTTIPINRVYYPNGTIYDDKDDIKVKYIPPKINFSDLG